MNTSADYTNALARLVKVQATAILSSGDGLKTRLESLIQGYLRNRPEDYIFMALEEYEVLKRHTHNFMPTIPGMYLKLLHGRVSVDEELDDWGPDGPWIGPLNWFHCTYLSDIGIGFVGGEELTSLSYSIEVPSPIYLCQEMIYHDGMYYGDWELQNIQSQQA